MRKVLDKYKNQLPQEYPKYRFNRLVKDVVRHSGIVESIQIVKLLGGQKKERWIPKWELVASHTCRRSFCTNKFMSGMSLIIIRAISGHASEQSLLRYVKVSPQEAAELALGRM